MQTMQMQMRRRAFQEKGEGRAVCNVFGKHEVPCISPVRSNVSSYVCIEAGTQGS